MGIYLTIRSMKPLELARMLKAGDNLAADRRKKTSNLVSLEKAWHGIHYLLTAAAPDDEPLGFLLEGGRPVGEDLGYGPARVLDHEEVAELDALLSGISDEAFWSGFNPEEMSAEGIYPDTWDEPEEDLREEYVGYFQELKKHVSKANADDCSMVITLN